MGKFKYKKYLYAEDIEYRREKCYLYNNEQCSTESEKCASMNNCTKYQNYLAKKSKRADEKNKLYIQNHLNRIKKERGKSTHYDTLIIFDYTFNKNGSKNENGLLIHNHMFSFILEDDDYFDDEIYPNSDIHIANVMLKMNDMYYLAFIDRNKVVNIDLDKLTIFFCIKTIDVEHPIESIDDTNLKLLFIGTDRKKGKISFYNID